MLAYLQMFTIVSLLFDEEIKVDKNCWKLFEYDIVVISYCNSLTNNKKGHIVVRYETQLMSSTTHTVVTYVVM